MQHSIDSAELLDQVGPQIEGMVQAIESCVHCGFCLAVCPTYLVLGEEMEFAARPDHADEICPGSRAECS